MECIRDFLEESYQHKLRLWAQSRSERYEDTIDIYKKIFLARLELIRKECMEKTSEHCEKNCADNSECVEIRKVIDSIACDEIEKFFDELRTIYLYWIDSKTSEAIERFKNLLKENDLLKYNKKIENFDVFFKGRISEQVLTSWDMFHIPFNKRYLIQNQRYSLTGQPMLYIGGSVLGIAQEIGVTNADDLKVSVITFAENDLKIFDLRTDINNTLLYIFLSKMLDEKVEYDKSTFFRMILSSVCSFQKRQELKGYTFCEEYVLPQILAQVLKTEGFDGIAYYSTKKYEVDFEGNIVPSLSFKENIAIFTNLDMKHVYDRKLYENISISVPVDRNKIYALTLDDLEKIIVDINKSKDQDKVTCAEMIFLSFKRIYGKMRVNGIEYIKTEYGKLHMYEIYTVLNQILVS